LADRSKQLSLGAKSTVKGTQGMNPKEVAKLEIENKVVPLLIERELPNGKIEKWNIRELTHIDFF
jgi:DNA-directed RNA polymerase subunit K/omega